VEEPLELEDDPPMSKEDVIRRARALAGAWSDLDWDETEAELYRIGHSSIPTPPIDLQDDLGEDDEPNAKS
jgi:hypothetical protein